MEYTTFEQVIRFTKEIFQSNEYIPLHEPRFYGREKELVNACIDSTFVSSVGEYVDLFESEVARYTGAKYAVAVVNGTQALFIALTLSGSRENTEVITQSLTFIATANAIKYTGAKPNGLIFQSAREFFEAQYLSRKRKMLQPQNPQADSSLCSYAYFRAPMPDKRNQGNL